MSVRWQWLPTALLAVGVLLTFTLDTQKQMPLRQSLGSVVPRELAGFAGEDVALSNEERVATGVSAYLMRTYRRADVAADFFSVYIGYYDQQSQGKTIHSPRNCLPGSGWEPLESVPVTLETRAGPVVVNQYVLQRGDQRALVLYWYQGRGRVEASEYAVKRDLLLDSALRGRSEEALVRVMVLMNEDQNSAVQLATRVASQLVPAAAAALPL